MMLARVVGRSLRSPALRAPPRSLPITSPQWTRTLASNFRRGPPRKPTDYTKPASIPSSPRPSSIGPQRVTGAASAFDGQGSNESKINHQHGETRYSKEQDEMSEGASPERNTVPQSEGGGAGTFHERRKNKEDPAYSKEQDEISEGGSPERNTASQSEGVDAGMSYESNKHTETAAYSDAKSEAASATAPSENAPFEAVAPLGDNTAESQEPTRPLPDLTQGIPSTIEYEIMGNKSARRPEGTSLNLTEDPAQGPSGRGRGELPASAYISSSEKKRLQVANYLYATLAATSILLYIYFGRNWDNEEEEREHPNEPSGWALGLMWNRAKARMRDQLNYYHEPAFKKLLPDQSTDPMFYRPYTLVLSMEDLLVHSEWSREHGWRTAKRPGVDYFLRYLNQYYELVIFTSVPWAIADPVIKKLDPYRIVNWPLYREATLYQNGEFIKDLSYLNRDLSKVIMIDTLESHARNQPENAVILPKWKGDPKDTELVSMIPFLEYIATMNYSDIRKVLDSFKGTHIPTEFARREAIARKRFEAEMEEERKRRPKANLGVVSNALGLKQGPMYEGEQTTAEAFAQGKTLLDQARERGQRNYEQLEKMIREQGEQWLKEEAANEELAKQEGMKAMKSGLTGFFGMPGSKPSTE